MLPKGSRPGARTRSAVNNAAASPKVVYLPWTALADTSGGGATTMPKKVTNDVTPTRALAHRSRDRRPRPGPPEAHDRRDDVETLLSRDAPSPAPLPARGRPSSASRASATSSVCRHGGADSTIRFAEDHCPAMPTSSATLSSVWHHSVQCSDASLPAARARSNQPLRASATSHA